MQQSTGIKIFFVYTFIIGLFLFGTWLGNETINVIYENQPITRTNRIVVDPGHGGEDGGASAWNGKCESTYNLEISLRLRDLLQLLGVETVMIRTNDSAVYTSGETIAQKKVSDLKERVRIANQTKGTTLVSIHQNYFTESKYSGAQVFYGSSTESEALAKKIQDCLVSSLNPGSHRKAKRGEGIYILEKAKCCSILVECGFISNPEEETRLSSSAYQKKLVEVISACIVENLSDA